MKLVGESATGGDLVAANIAASPLENLGTIAKLSLVGGLFSSPRFYKAFTRKYKRLSEGEDVKSRGKIVGELLSDALSSAIGQGTAQSIDQAVGEVTDQAKSLIENTIDVPEQTSKTQTNIQVPQIAPIPEIADPQVTDVSIRQRARENPAVAATLLGGLGSAGLL